MVDPEGRNVEPSALLAAITNLTAGVERLQQFLNERQQEATALTAAVDRVSARSAGMTGALQALQQKSEQMSGEIDELRREHAILTRALAGYEQQQGSVMTALTRVGDLEHRLADLENSSRQSPVAPAPTAGELWDDPAQNELAALYTRQAEVQTALDDLLQRQRSAAPLPAEPAEPARQGGLGLSLSSISDLYRRIDRLDRKEEALSRIIELVVERARLVARREPSAGAERA